VFVRVTNIPLDLALDPPKALLLLQTAIAVAFGGAVYVAASTLFRVSELEEIVSYVRTRGLFGRA